MASDLQCGAIEKPFGESPPLSWKTGRRDFSNINGLLILKSTLENAWSSASQKTIQTEVIYLYLLKDSWEQIVFPPNSLDCTTFQGFKNWSSAWNAKYYIFALRLCSVSQKNTFPGKHQGSVWYSACCFSPFFECGSDSINIENKYIVLHFFSVLVNLCSHIEQSSSGRNRLFFFFFCFAFLVKIQETSHCR